jgi:hypothetical protein
MKAYRIGDKTNYREHPQKTGLAFPMPQLVYNRLARKVENPQILKQNESKARQRNELRTHAGTNKSRESASHA